MTKSPRKDVLDLGIELGAACMPSGHASDRATASGRMRVWALGMALDGGERQEKVHFTNGCVMVVANATDLILNKAPPHSQPWDTQEIVTAAEAWQQKRLRRSSTVEWIYQHRDMVCEKFSWLHGCSVETPICGYLPVVTRSRGPFQRPSRDLALYTRRCCREKQSCQAGARHHCFLSNPSRTWW